MNEGLFWAGLQGGFPRADRPVPQGERGPSPGTPLQRGVHEEHASVSRLPGMACWQGNRLQGTFSWQSGVCERSVSTYSYLVPSCPVLFFFVSEGFFHFFVVVFVVLSPLFCFIACSIVQVGDRTPWITMRKICSGRTKRVLNTFPP